MAINYVNRNTEPYQTPEVQDPLAASYAPSNAPTTIGNAMYSPAPQATPPIPTAPDFASMVPGQFYARSGNSVSQGFLGSALAGRAAGPATTVGNAMYRMGEPNQGTDRTGTIPSLNTAQTSTVNSQMFGPKAPTPATSVGGAIGTQAADPIDIQAQAEQYVMNTLPPAQRLLVKASPTSPEAKAVQAKIATRKSQLEAQHREDFAMGMKTAPANIAAESRKDVANIKGTYDMDKARYGADAAMNRLVANGHLKAEDRKAIGEQRLNELFKKYDAETALVGTKIEAEIKAKGIPSADAAERTKAILAIAKDHEDSLDQRLESTQDANQREMILREAINVQKFVASEAAITPKEDTSKATKLANQLKEQATEKTKPLHPQIQKYKDNADKIEQAIVATKALPANDPRKASLPALEENLAKVIDNALEFRKLQGKRDKAFAPEE